VADWSHHLMVRRRSAAATRPPSLAPSRAAGPGRTRTTEGNSAQNPDASNDTNTPDPADLDLRRRPRGGSRRRRFT